MLTSVTSDDFLAGLAIQRVLPFAETKIVIDVLAIEAS